MRSISCVLVLYIFFRQILERWSYVVLSACVVSSNVSSPFLFLRQELELLRGKQRQEAQELRSQQRSFFDEAVMVKWKWSEKRMQCPDVGWCFTQDFSTTVRWKKRTPRSTGKNNQEHSSCGIGLVAAIFGYVWRPGRSAARCLISRQPASSCFPVSLRPKLLWCGSVCCHHCGHNRLCVAIATLLSLDFIHTRQILWRRQWRGSVSWIVMLFATNSQLWSEIVLPDW